MKKSCRILFLIIVCELLSQPIRAQTLPQPSGRFSIGYHRLEWTDDSRVEILSANGSMRQIAADVWYPTEISGGITVPYLDTLAVSRALGDKGLQSFLGTQGATVIRSGRIHTHGQENAPFAGSLKSAPVIFFSHGMGMISQLYTTQIEDLASHGYIVVALSHPYDAWLVSFSDGKQVLFETQQRQTANTTEEQQIAYENKRLEWWAADISFALDQLAGINRKKSKTIPFAGYMNLRKVGAMGHSSGGRAAARACQLDARIKSCADQDGVAMMQPFYLNPAGAGMKQPFLLFERDRNKNPDEAAAVSMGLSLQELTSLVDRLRDQKKAALAATGGSFHVLLNFENSNHMSFSDLPLLQATNTRQTSHATELLRVTCRYTREFFDQTLRGTAAPLYESEKRLNYIDLVQSYPKAGSKK